jgi:hypothetical protein
MLFELQNEKEIKSNFLKKKNKKAHPYMVK